MQKFSFAIIVFHRRTTNNWLYAKDPQDLNRFETAHPYGKGMSGVVSKRSERFGLIPASVGARFRGLWRARTWPDECIEEQPQEPLL